MTQNEKNHKEWENSSNWKWSTFYHSKKDSRVWVYKKSKWMGWTLNFAKKQSYVWLFSLILIPVIIITLIYT